MYHRGFRIRVALLGRVYNNGQVATIIGLSDLGFKLYVVKLSDSGLGLQGLASIGTLNPKP